MNPSQIQKACLMLFFLLLFFGSVHASVFLTDLVAYYKFDETTGTIIEDSHNGYDGTLIGSTLGQTGIINDAILFQKSTTDKVTVGDETNFDFLTDENANWSVSLWFKSTESLNEQRTLLAKYQNNASTDRRGTWLVMDAGRPNLRMYQGSSNSVSSFPNWTPYQENDGNWHHLVVIKTGNNWDSSSDYNWYLDGVYDSTISRTSTGINPNPANDYNFSMGNMADGASAQEAYQGDLDEIGVWERAISSSEVTTLYNGGSGYSYDNFVPAVSLTANFVYEINKESASVDLNDTSVPTGGLVIDRWEWTVNGSLDSATQNYVMPATGLTDYNVCLFVEDSTDTYNDTICKQFNTGDWTAPSTTLASNQVEGTNINTLTFTCTDNNSGCKQTYYNINSEGWNVVANTGTADVNYVGTGNNSVSYFSEDNNDNNESTNSGNFSTYGTLAFNFRDDTSGLSLDQVTVTFDGNVYGPDTNTFVYLGLEGIASGDKLITMEKTGYQTKSFTLNVDEFTHGTYNLGFITTSKAISVPFQVFTYLGTVKTDTTFFGYDVDTNYLISVQTTDGSGKMSFYLNNTKSEYYFISTDLNFGTTTWTFKKPKDALTFDNIDGNWKYSITGNSFSSEANIVSDVTKILLQNTTNPYYIKIQDVNESYYESSFGLKSVTSELTKTLNSYLYPVGSADLVLIKLLDFSTNQPISEFLELDLSVYTDTNGLLEIGTYVNDSTGTYNIYMDSNSQYQLVVNEQVFTLKPTLSIYYLYLTEPSGLDPEQDINVVVNDFNTVNVPNLPGEVREFFFGCPADGSDCYPSMIFALIFVVIIVVGLSAVLTVGSLEQTILFVVLLGMFTFMTFIPVWLFAIGAVVAVLWGVFS